MRRGEPLPDDAVGIGLAGEAVVRIVDERHPAGHPGAEIGADRAEHHRDAAGHIFAAIGAAALDHEMLAPIPAREPLARLTRGIDRARRRAVEPRVAGARLLLALALAAVPRAHR